MSAFLAMGGYGAYVWTAYALFVLVLLADLIAPWLRRRRLPAQLRGQLQRQAPRRPREQPVPVLELAVPRESQDRRRLAQPASPCSECRHLERRRGQNQQQ